MTCVPDALPLIAFSKIEKVEILPGLYGKVMLTPQVLEEAIAKGKAMGATDTPYLEQSIAKSGFIKVRLTVAEKEVVQRLREKGAGLGEAEVMAVAIRRRALAILDDKDARAFAVGMGVQHAGTVGVLYEAFLQKLMNYDELIELLEKLGRVAWISPDLLAGIIKRAREVTK